MRKLFIWGAGDIGRRIRYHLSDDWVITFVDSNKQRIGLDYCGKSVIGIEEYLEKYSSDFILIAHLQEEVSIQILNANHINNFFVHCDLPGEFKEPYIRNTLKEYIIHYLRNRTDYVLYGLNLYSIIIDEWIYKYCGIHPYILPQKDVSENIINKITQQYDGLQIIESVQELDGINELCVCTEDYTGIKELPAFHEYHVTDIFDCSDKIKSYYNVKIEKFHNIHQGQRCFIVATGPSLKMEDLDVLKEKKEICFSMNHIFVAFPMTDWRPDYYVMDDWIELKDNKTLIDSWSTIKAKFVGDTSEEFWKTPHRKDVYCYHKHYEHYLKRLPKFSDNLAAKSYTGTTVTYTCMQLAAYMGFKEIYLLGVDFSYGESQLNQPYMQFYKQDVSELSMGFVNQVSLAYKAAEKYTREHGIRIYNATRGGKLETFERVDFDHLF